MCRATAEIPTFGVCFGMNFEAVATNVGVLDDCRFDTDHVKRLRDLVVASSALLPKVKSLSCKVSRSLICQ